VHAVIDPIQVKNEIKHTCIAVGKGIEDADLDIRVRIHGGDLRIAARRVDVIDQEPDPQNANLHTPVSGLDKALGQDPAGGIRLPDVVLQIQALLCQFGQFDTSRKGRAPIADDASNSCPTLVSW
jgi:hypothetical protein